MEMDGGGAVVIAVVAEVVVKVNDPMFTVD